VHSRTVSAVCAAAELTEQEAAVNRWKIRLCATTAGLAACGVILAGCGSGQISQTATQHAAVNGTAAEAKDIALRNVHLLAEQTSDFLQPGATVPLLFVAANNSVDAGDTLVGITSDVGTVAVTGDSAIPPGGALVVGAAGDRVEAMGSARPVVAEVTLTEPITNGLTYNFTFNFAKAGKVTVAVPISAGEPAPE
jgi:copper(I)-binding protein